MQLTGIMEFQDTPMYLVINTLSDYFEIPIDVEKDEIIQQKLTTQFNNLDIDEILDKIQSTFNCQISGDGSKIVIN